MISEIGAGGRYQHTCPVPIAQEMLIERKYGELRFYWWGSPHRLYVRGESIDGSPLGIRGSRVEAFAANSPDSLLAGYPARVTFAEATVDNRAPPAPETFAIEVFEGNQFMEAIPLRYVPRLCHCVGSPW